MVSMPHVKGRLAGELTQYGAGSEMQRGLYQLQIGLSQSSS